VIAGCVEPLVQIADEEEEELERQEPLGALVAGLLSSAAN